MKRNANNYWKVKITADIERYQDSQIHECDQIELNWIQPTSLRADTKSSGAKSSTEELQYLAGLEGG